MTSNEVLEQEISELKYAIHGNFVTQAIGAACQLDIFDLFEVQDQILTVDSIAKSTSSNAYSLSKLLKYLSMLGLLKISSNRTSYSITSKGELLKKTHPSSMYHFALLHSTSLFRGASSFLTESIQNNRSGTSYFCGTDMFSYLKTHSQDSEVFNKAMSNLTSMHADSVAQFIKKMGAKKILDAGGGIGTLLCAILKKSPDAQGVIVDLPNLQEPALEYVRECQLASRIDFLPKSFFDDFQSVAEVITLHHVLHDYHDEDCLRILENCRKSLSRNGSILIIETLLGKDAKIGIGWLKDLIMHVTTLGGRVRSEEDFRHIISRSGLEIKEVHPLTAYSSDLSIIQLVHKSSSNG